MSEQRQDGSAERAAPQAWHAGSYMHSRLPFAALARLWVRFGSGKDGHMAAWPQSVRRPLPILCPKGDMQAFLNAVWDVAERQGTIRRAWSSGCAALRFTR